MPRKAEEKNMKHELVSDEKLYDDLVNNFKQFHIHNSESDLLDFHGKWDDDSDYSDYRTIEDLLENLTEEDLDKSHIVSVDIKDINSSEESLGGCDRPMWSIQSNSAINQQHKSLNRHGCYRQDAAGVLSGMLRPHPILVNEDGRTCKWQLSKYIGNNRVAMKLFVHAGVSTRVLMMIRFHQPGLSAKKYIAIESELHATDAGDRSGQNEQQKFTSGYRANREPETYCFDFLKRHQIEYGTIMQQEGVEGADQWLILKSLQGIKDGKGNGHFKKYGENHVSYALKTIKEVAKQTKETVVGATPVEAFSLMFSIYTTNGKRHGENITPIFTPEQLHEYFVALFKSRNNDDAFGLEDRLLLSDLSWSGGVKDVAYICARTFWPTIKGYWKKSVCTSDTPYSFSNDAYANKKLVDWSKDKHLKKEIIGMVA
tara:strand:- start:414 stop:1697 length:1284 start_codon:yes stop_codon:yes gene_type:complete